MVVVVVVVVLVVVVVFGADDAGCSVVDVDASAVEDWAVVVGNGATVDGTVVGSGGGSIFGATIVRTTSAAALD